MSSKPKVSIALLERSRHALLPRPLFYRRMLAFGVFSFSILAVSLGIGILGYHWLEGMGWIDALLNASMILGGMGPVDSLKTDSGKVFASAYAIFSGVVFLVSVGVLITPVAHRLFHHFHLELEEKRRR